MFYREAGQFKTNYAADQALLPILQDRIGLGVILLVAFVGVPLFASDFFIGSIMIPFLVFALAAIGLNVLTGYAGQLSLGSGAFMGVGAYACYKLTTLFPDTNIIILILFSGVFSAIAGVIFGLPSLRIKGLYLAITTLAAQFFSNGVSYGLNGYTTTTIRGLLKSHKENCSTWRLPAHRQARPCATWLLRQLSRC